MNFHFLYLLKSKPKNIFWGKYDIRTYGRVEAGSGAIIRIYGTAEPPLKKSLISIWYNNLCLGLVLNLDIESGLHFNGYSELTPYPGFFVRGSDYYEIGRISHVSPGQRGGRSSHGDQSCSPRRRMADINPKTYPSLQVPVPLFTVAFLMGQCHEMDIFVKGLNILLILISTFQCKNRRFMVFEAGYCKDFKN